MTTLLSIDTDGTCTDVPNTYEGIRDACRGCIDYVWVHERIGVFVNDEGLLNRAELNVPVSSLTGRALYGPAVLCRGDTDDEGNTLVMDDRDANSFRAAAAMWRSVISTARRAGQDIRVWADPDTIPPSRIIPLPEDWNFGDPIPGVEE